MDLFRKPIKVIRVGINLAIILPAQVCRDLEIYRGQFLVMRIWSERVIVLEKLETVSINTPIHPEGEAEIKSK